jgi:hypothetical protein
MPERRDLLLAEGGGDRDREVEGCVQHTAPALGAGLQAACPVSLQLNGTKSNWTAPGCDVDSLIKLVQKLGPVTKSGTNCRSDFAGTG